MSFTIQEQKYFPAPSKSVEYILKSNLTLVQNVFDHTELFKQQMRQYFMEQSLQEFNVGCLVKLMKIELHQNHLNCMQSIVSEYMKSKNVQKRYRFYLLLKVFKNVEFPLKEFVDILSQTEYNDVMGILLGLCLFQDLQNIFNDQLEECYQGTRANNIKSKVFEYYSHHNTKIDKIIHNLQQLQMKTQQFKNFILSIISFILQDKQNLICKQFQKLLLDISKKGQNFSDSILFLLSNIQSLIPIYTKTLKQYFSSLVSPQHLLQFNSKYLDILGTRKYYQLTNFYYMGLKQWSNENQNIIKLFNLALKSQIRHAFTKEFLQYVEDFKDAQELLVANYFKYYDFHKQTETDYINEVEKVIGWNYTGTIWQVLKELNPIDIINVGDIQIKIRSSNISLYPKHWKHQNLTEIIKSKEIQTLNRHKVIKQGLIKLKKWEQDSNCKDPTRHRDISHHQISIKIDNKIQLLVSLQQLSLVFQMVQGVSNLTYMDQLVSAHSSLILDAIKNQKKSRVKLSDLYYPMVSNVAKVKQQIEPPPVYVLQGKIIKLMKRNKEMNFQGIVSSLNFEEQLLRVMLQNLIKKGFLEIKNDLYLYVP